MNAVSSPSESREWEFCVHEAICRTLDGLTVDNHEDAPAAARHHHNKAMYIATIITTEQRSQKQTNLMRPTIAGGAPPVMQCGVHARMRTIHLVAKGWSVVLVALTRLRTL